MRARPAIPLTLLAALGGAFAVAQLALAAPAEEPATAIAPVTAAGPRPISVLPGVAATASRPRSAPPEHGIAELRGNVALSDRPRGPVTQTVGATTEFGSPRVLGVAARRGNWLGVVTSERPNGSLGWVRKASGSVRVRSTRWSLHADLSARRLTLRRGGRRVHRVSVAIGAAGSETPTGRFAVTDKLSGSQFGPYYGCCILALSGHQPNTPAGWKGGDRLAIHGTDAPGTIGTAASAGCLRASDEDLQTLMDKVPLGTPVFVRA
jgi:lipoprotein-anchoring transpeptidase ErfK/SrfK